MSYQNIKEIRNTVGYNLFKDVFSIYIIIAVIITAFHMYSEYNNAKSSVLEDMKNTEKVLKKQLVSTVWNLDILLLEDIISGILDSQSIIGVSININDSEITGNFGVVDKSKKIAQNLKFTNKIKVIYENNLYSRKFDLENVIYENTLNLGNVIFYSDDNVIYKKLKNNFLLIIINSMIKTFALWIIFLFFANKYLTKPLFEIIKITNNVDFNKLDKIKFGHNTVDENEFDILKNTFNKMFRKLDKSNKMNLELNKSLEQKVKDRTAALEDSLKNLEEAQEKMIESEKMASLGSLVAGVAHEINTPVGIGVTGISHISYITEDIKEKYKSNNMSEGDFESYLEETQKLSTIISLNLERTSEIIKNFKQVAIDQTSEQRREFNVNNYINGILLSVSTITKSKDIDIKINCDEKLEIISYPGFLSQILTNLIINSVRHGFKERNKGTILIDVKFKNNIIELIYKDDGVGIPSENVPKVFNPFFTTSRNSGGTGLGLSIIYNIVTSNLNGFIQCKSNKDDGVEFHISFPI